MLVNYISAGFNPDQFWKITLREYLIHMEGASDRLEREQNALAWSAHTTATLGRIDGKRFPRLADIQSKKQSKTAEHPIKMAQIARAWDAAINNGVH